MPSLHTLRPLAWPALLTLGYAVLPARLLAAAWGPDRVVGSWASEAFARMAVTRQVARWVEGAAPWGFADLLNHPGGRPFWPVDPVLQALAVPLGVALGDTRGFTALVGLLLLGAGLGVCALARALGAGRGGAALAGGLAQGSPWVLTHAEDGILEVLALGLAALAACAVRRVLEQGRPRDLAALGLAVALCAGSSPYAAVYLALGCALSLPGWPTRRWVGVVGASALACALALAPFAWAERHEQGRLGPRYAASGFHLSPSPLVDPGTGAPSRRPRARAEAPDPRAHPAPGPPSPWERQLRRFPGGLAPLLGAVAALFTVGARRWGLLALGVWLGGPAPGVLARGFGMEVADPSGPLNHLLRALPLLESLGNPTRLLGMSVMLGALCAALAARRWPVGLGLAALGATELALARPDLRLPSTRLNLDPAVLGTLPGPTVVFPSGDPPAWQAEVSHGEALLYTAVAGVPGAYDYGVNAQAADLPTLVALSRAAGVPIAQEALRREATPGDFAALLVLEDRLRPEERRRLRAWLEPRAQPLAESEGLSAWALQNPTNLLDD